LGGVCAVLALILFVPFGKCLTVRDHENGALILALPLKEGESFDLRYTHSVNLSDVTDTIERRNDLLVCTQTLFTAYGVGIPVLADGIGTDFIQTDEGFLITGIDHAQDSIPVLTQPFPNQRILHRGEEISLVEAAGSGRVVELRVESVTLTERLLGRHTR